MQHSTLRHIQWNLNKTTTSTAGVFITSSKPNVRFATSVRLYAWKNSIPAHSSLQMGRFSKFSIVKETCYILTNTYISLYRSNQRILTIFCNIGLFPYITTKIKTPAVYKFYLHQLQFKWHLPVNSANAGVFADTPNDVPPWEKICNGFQSH
jgi:hypothetical protein